MPSGTTDSSGEADVFTAGFNASLNKSLCLLPAFSPTHAKQDVGVQESFYPDTEIANIHWVQTMSQAIYGILVDIFYNT